MFDLNYTLFTNNFAGKSIGQSNSMAKYSFYFLKWSGLEAKVLQVIRQAQEGV